MIVNQIGFKKEGSGQMELNFSKSDAIAGVGVLFLVYGGCMIHAAIAPIVIGLVLVWLGVRGVGNTPEAE